MARQYLAEGVEGAFPFVPDAGNIVVESLPIVPTGTTPLRPVGGPGIETQNQAGDATGNPLIAGGRLEVSPSAGQSALMCAHRGSFPECRSHRQLPIPELLT